MTTKRKTPGHLPALSLYKARLERDRMKIARECARSQRSWLEMDGFDSARLGNAATALFSVSRPHNAWRAAHHLPRLAGRYFSRALEFSRLPLDELRLWIDAAVGLFLGL